MRIETKLLNFLVCAVLFGACKTETAQQQMNIAPPIAKKIPKVFEEYGKKRTDDYFWLNDPKNPAVIDYLNAENQYVTQSLAHTEGVQKKLYEEITNRLEQQSQTVPIKKRVIGIIRAMKKGKNTLCNVAKKATLTPPKKFF